MINSSVTGISGVSQNVANMPKPDKMTKFMRSKALAKICDVSAKNPVLTQALFSLGICLFLRPITNYAITDDKQDAAYASGHSIASGVIGTLWPLIIVTPITTAVAKVFKKPHKFLKPEIIKKFYPNVGIKEITRDGKTVKKVMTDLSGKMVRQDGSPLIKELVALTIENGDALGKAKEIEKRITKLTEFKGKLFDIAKEEKIARINNKIKSLEAQHAELMAKHNEFTANKIAFEKQNPKLYVDDVGVVRSREVFKTKDGKIQYDKKGNKIGCYVLKEDKTPVTEELERGINKESNMKDLLKWGVDILLAPPRALLTIACIPPVLSLLHIQKSKKPVAVVNTMKPIQGFDSFKKHLVSATDIKGGV